MLLESLTIPLMADQRENLQYSIGRTEDNG